MKIHEYYNEKYKLAIVKLVIDIFLGLSIMYSAPFWCWIILVMVSKITNGYTQAATLSNGWVAILTHILLIPLGLAHALITKKIKAINLALAKFEQAENK